MGRAYSLARRQTDRGKQTTSLAEAPENASSESHGRSSRKSGANRGNTPTKAAEEESDTQAKVAAARSRVAAARAQKAANDTQEDLPASVAAAPAPTPPVTSAKPAEENPADTRILELLGSQVKRLHVRSEETQRRLESLEKRYTGLEERLDQPAPAPDDSRQTQLEIQLSHQGQELLDQRAIMDALNRRLTEQYSILQREMQEIVTRMQTVPEPVTQAAAEPVLDTEAHFAALAAQQASATLAAERDSWMERCVDLETAQMEYLQSIEQKEAEIQRLSAALESSRQASEGVQLELMLRDEELQILNQRFDSMREGGENTQLELMIRDEELTSLRDSLSSRESQIREIEEALRSREEELAELSVYNEETDAARVELEKEIKALRASASSSEQLSALSAEVELKDQEIRELARQLEERELELEDLNTQALERETIVENLQAEMAEKETSLTALRNLLAAHESTIEKLEQGAGVPTETSSDSELGEELGRLRNSYRLLKSDFEELQSLHQDLREEHMTQTTSLNEERLQLDRGLEQARQQLRSLSERYSKQMDTSERLVRQLALTDNLLDEAEVVLDALPPPPPSLALPVRRLRSKISEIRANRQALEGHEFQSYEDRIAALQQELVETRQRLLEAHSQLDADERERDRLRSRLRELESK